MLAGKNDVLGWILEHIIGEAAPQIAVSLFGIKAVKVAAMFVTIVGLVLKAHLPRRLAQPPNVRTQVVTRLVSQLVE